MHYNKQNKKVLPGMPKKLPGKMAKLQSSKMLGKDDPQRKQRITHGHLSVSVCPKAQFLCTCSLTKESCWINSSLKGGRIWGCFRICLTFFKMMITWGSLYFKSEAKNALEYVRSFCNSLKKLYMFFPRSHSCPS